MNLPKTTATTTKTTISPSTRRNDVIDRGVIDRGVIVRPPNIVITREDQDEDETFREQNYKNISTKGKLLFKLNKTANW